ncbi:MAG: FkbM family methyltransferase [bacterium]
MYNYLVLKTKSDYADDVHGHKMYLGDNDFLHISVNGNYEPSETRFFQNEVKEGNIVIDIGANIGYFTLLFAKHAGKRGHVYAFEPEPYNFGLLKKNIEINGYTNVTLVNKAVSDCTGKLELFLNEDNRGDHRIYNSHDGRRSLIIDSISLDDYFADFDGKINLIKMDIQGAEYHALKGMISLLSKNPQIVVETEFWPFGLLCSGIEPKVYLELFLELGFTIYLLNEEKQMISKADHRRLLDIYTPENRLHTNLVLKR